MRLKAYALTSDRETFVQGATALRNARDLARQQRETFIRAANIRATQTGASASTRYRGKTSGEDALDLPTEATAWHDFHDDLQQQIANTYVEDREDDGEAPNTPEDHHSSDESPELGEDATAAGTDCPSMSFASSFTSSLSTATSRPKRSRRSLSSPTQGHRLSKSRFRATASQQRAVSPVATAKLEPS